MTEIEKSFKWKLENELAILSSGDVKHEGFDLTLLEKAMDKDRKFKIQCLYFVCKQKLSNKKADTKGKSQDFKLKLMVDTWNSLIAGEWSSKKTSGYNKEAAGKITSLEDIRTLVTLSIPLTEEQEALLKTAQNLQDEENKKNEE